MSSTTSRSTASPRPVRGPGLGPACDLGCGPGHVARHLHARGLSVTGFDLSRGMLAAARRLNPGLPFAQADMRALPVANGEELGGIAAFYSILHLPRPRGPRGPRQCAGPSGRGASCSWPFTSARASSTSTNGGASRSQSTSSSSRPKRSPAGSAAGFQRVDAVKHRPLPRRRTPEPQGLPPRPTALTSRPTPLYTSAMIVAIKVTGVAG